VVAVWLRGPEFHIASAGDSRAYLVGNFGIEQITVDDTVPQALVEAGTITAEEAKEHRFRHVLWRYLGSSQLGKGPKVRRVQVEVGHRLLLCTDGLTNWVSDDGLLRTIGTYADVQHCAAALCHLAVDSGSRDNVSCIVIEVVEARDG
jgi:protein phosphatase